MENTNELRNPQDHSQRNQINGDETISRYAHCVLPAHFFDLMLSKQSRNAEEDETQVIEVIKPKTNFPRC